MHGYVINGVFISDPHPRGGESLWSSPLWEIELRVIKLATSSSVISYHPAQPPMPRKYLGGSGDALTVWISIAASTVLIFYGYDQGVFGNVLVGQDFLDTMGSPSTSVQGTMTS